VLEKTYQIKNPDSFTGTQTPRFYEEKQWKQKNWLVFGCCGL
jgi:hypothetical protein